MKVASFECDVCGKSKQNDANRWLTVIMTEVKTGSGEDFTQQIQISEWDETFANVENVKHICGVDCAIKQVARLLPELMR